MIDKDVVASPAGFSSGRGFAAFKAIVYTLLIVDAALLYLYGNWREVVEQSGWLLILAAFEWESGRGLLARDVTRGSDGRKHRFASILELAGYALAVFSWGAYGLAAEWQNFGNATLWLLIAAALAYDLHVPGRYGGGEWRLRNIGKSALYLGVAGIALSWGLDGAWLDFWDAMIWLTCFFVIELKIFDFEDRRRTRRAA